MEKQILKLLVIGMMVCANLKLNAQVTAVLNQNPNSASGTSFITTCSTSESPVFYIQLWSGGSHASISGNTMVSLKWFKRTSSGNVLVDDIALGGTISSQSSKITMVMNNQDFTFQLDGFTQQTSSADREPGAYFARVELTQLDPPYGTPVYTTNIINITEGQAPSVTVNGLYNNFSNANKYSVLSGCNSGDVILRVHPSQTCALDAFTLAVWETDGFGNDIGSHYWRPLTSTEIGNVSGSGATGINIQTLNSNVTGGSNNGTIKMTAGKHYGVEFKYTGQNTSQPTYLTIHYKSGTVDLVVGDASLLDAQSGAYEPVGKWYTNVFSSPDLWNKLSTSSNPGDGKHENPDYSATNSSKILFKVTNVGCATSAANTPVRLFWTRARSTERWSKDWLYDTVNNGVISAFNSQKIAAGSEITITGATNAKPYNTNTSPYLIPALGAGASYTLSFADGVTWYPPDPIDFDATNGSMSGNKVYPIICLLARINEKNSVNDPILWQPSNDTDDILPYVKGNNNVATRNTWLVNSPQHIVIGANEGWHHGYGTVLVNNPYKRAIRVNLCIDKIPESSPGTFLDYGAIQLGTGDALNTAWSVGGAQATNIHQNSATAFTLSDGTHACLNNLTLPPGFQDQLGLKFEFNASTLPMSSQDYGYRFSQVILDSTYSGDSLFIDSTYCSDVVYLVNVPSIAPFSPGAITLGIDGLVKNSNLNIYPNPSNRLVKIAMKGRSENSELVVTNPQGVQVRKISYNNKGEWTETLDVSQWASGVYTIEFKSGGQVTTQKLSIVH